MTNLNLTPVPYFPADDRDARLYTAVTGLADRMVNAGQLVHNFPGYYLTCAQADTLGVILHIAGFHAHGAHMVAFHLDRGLWADDESPCTSGGLTVHRYRSVADDSRKALTAAHQRVTKMARGLTLASAVEAFALDVSVDGFDNGDRFTCTELNWLVLMLAAGGHVEQSAELVMSHGSDERDDAHHIPRGYNAERFARAYVLGN